MVPNNFFSTRRKGLSASSSSSSSEKMLSKVISENVSSSDIQKASTAVVDAACWSGYSKGYESDSYLRPSTHAKLVQKIIASPEETRRLFRRPR